MFFLRQEIRLIKKIKKGFSSKRSNRFLRLSVPVCLLSILYIFSFSISSQYLGSLANLNDNQVDNSQLIIEKGLPAIPQTTKKLNFSAAAFKEKDLELPLTLNGSALILPDIQIEETTPVTRNKVQIYVVKKGDTVSEIAEKFGLKWSTILWANNFHYWSIIKPGQELKILPVDGLLHKIKKGENLSYIAKRYKSSIKDILEINNLNENSKIQPNDILIIPNGTPPPAPKPTYKTTNKTIFVKGNSNCSYSSWRSYKCASQCHRFWRYPGQCTDWVAYRWATEQGQCIPNWGNARDWLWNARNAGYKTGLTPRKGAIVILWCNNWYKHVAYVEDFDKNYIYFSEMNGPAGTGVSAMRKLRRTTEWQKTQGWWQIKGYIYPR